MNKLILGDCMEVLSTLPKVQCIFADPPDGIDWNYESFKDQFSNYPAQLYKWLLQFISQAETVWVSFNTKWIFEMGAIVKEILYIFPYLEARLCIQTFNFGRYREDDMTNNYRPLLRIKRKNTPIYEMRIESERQRLGDKRANPLGRVPGDVFDIPRVTGNSHQRRPWHPTQLNEDLVKRCILLSTKEGDTVIDPFFGTNTTGRVCKRLNRNYIGIEISPFYYKKALEENN